MRVNLRRPQELCVGIPQGRQHAAQRLVSGRFAVQAATGPLQANLLVTSYTFPQCLHTIDRILSRKGSTPSCRAWMELLKMIMLKLLRNRIIIQALLA